MGHIIFSHGKESGPWGDKIRHLTSSRLKLGFTFEMINYQGIPDPDVRAEKLLKHLQKQPFCPTKPLYLLGSSMGAYVSLNARATSGGHECMLHYLRNPNHDLIP